MKIKVKEVINNCNFDEDKVYQLVSQDYCCPQMAYATEDDRVRLITENAGNYDELNLHPAWELIFVDTSLDYDGDSSYPNRYDNENTYEIHYCPFCGKPIEIEISSSEDITEEYSKISKLRDELNVKRRNTDSKKKERELDKQVAELDEQMRKMWD